MSSTLSSQVSIPHGYRFWPTEEEIFFFYLRPAINGEPLSSNAVTAVEIYGENKEPWRIFDKDAKESFWVFTKLKKTSRAKIDSTAGRGCWLNRSSKEVKDAHGKLLGLRKCFAFICKNDQSSRGNGRWIMHEFSLDEEGLNDYVICEIKNKDAVGSDHQNQVESQKCKTPVVKKDEALAICQLKFENLGNQEKQSLDNQVPQMILFISNLNISWTPS